MNVYYFADKNKSTVVSISVCVCKCLTIVSYRTFDNCLLFWWIESSKAQTVYQSGNSRQFMKNTLTTFTVWLNYSLFDFFLYWFLPHSLCTHFIWFIFHFLSSGLFSSFSFKFFSKMKTLSLEIAIESSLDYTKSLKEVRERARKKCRVKFW